MRIGKLVEAFVRTGSKVLDIVLAEQVAVDYVAHFAWKGGVYVFGERV